MSSNKRYKSLRDLPAYPKQQQRGQMQVCSRKCNQCLFSKDRLVSADQANALIRASLQDGGFFNCHKGSIAGEPLVCNQFWQTYRHKCDTLQLAQRLDAMFGGGNIHLLDPDTMQKVGTWDSKNDQPTDCQTIPDIKPIPDCQTIPDIELSLHTGEDLQKKAQ